MKRFITMMVAVCAFLAVTAQNPMVTLSHNGELSFFNGLSAFKDALDKADNGDIVYLSEGDYFSPDLIRIIKKVSIVGVGHKSNILCDLLIHWKDAIDTISGPLFDGVRLGKVDVYYDVNLPLPKNIEICRSRIKQIKNGGYIADNLTIDKCFIESLNIEGSETHNVSVTNSKLGTFVYKSENAYVRNCNIKKLTNYPKILISSIVDNPIQEGPSSQYNADRKSIIYNTLFKDECYAVDSNNVYPYDCYSNGEIGDFLDENLDWQVIDDLERLGYLGQDGTVIGIMGGEFPFSENPSVPTVDTAKSSVTYDAEGNKLKVNITVKAD